MNQQRPETSSRENRIFMLRLQILIVAMLSVALPGWADRESAIQAYKSADYSAAFCEFSHLAEAGDVEAQHYLGWLYLKGLGVRQDYTQSALWFRRPAEKGHRVSQNALESAYLF